MDLLLEEKRSLHEERDRIEVAVVNEILGKKLGHKEKLDSEHRQKVLIDRYMKCSKSLLQLYKQEPSKKVVNPFREFYNSLKTIKDFHTKHSDEQATTIANEFEEIEVARLIAIGLKPKTSNAPLAAEEGENDIGPEDEEVTEEPTRDHELERLAKGLPTVDLVEVAETQPVPIVTRVEKSIEFTDEEGYGRYLDLNKAHAAYLQVIKHEENKPNYLAFLDKFDDFQQISKENKLSTLYKNYIELLLEYFRDFSKRAKPLFDHEEFENKTHQEFLEKWNQKTLPYWFEESDRTNLIQSPMVDLESYKSPLELSELGMDCLKKELQARGLKCGGSLQERAARLWLVRGKLDSEIDPSLRAGVTTKKGRKTTIDPFYIASVEAKLIMYAEYYNDIRQSTIENVQRKQARTAEERNESDDDVSDVEEEDNNDSDVIYNPKNLPLGWDGKPIPYWLYKLHGLNLSFTCEICGNATYKGPKTFQRHFAEWRHAHGMRCLGIPNTAHFANVTKIQDAINLWEKLKVEKQKDKFQPAQEEEYEDTQGNVLNKKTYEDLKRQGLL